MKITLRELLEEYTYDVYIGQIGETEYDKKMSEYTKLKYNEDFYQLAIKFQENNKEKYLENYEEDDKENNYRLISHYFINNIQDSYIWINLSSEEIDIDNFL